MPSAAGGRVFLQLKPERVHLKPAVDQRFFNRHCVAFVGDGFNPEPNILCGIRQNRASLGEGEATAKRLRCCADDILPTRGRELPGV